jgi:TPR repeat protein
MIHRLGKKDEIPVDNAKAIERFEVGCSQDFRNSCFYLGVMFLQGSSSVSGRLASSCRLPRSS